MSGRIADIAIHPEDEATWYVAAGSGGVWKTTNAGVTFAPVFDEQPSYSIGCVTIDPSQPNVVWVGTGENVGGRHVGFGDGVYRSDDGGAHWQAMGLPDSQHIAEIIVHPTDSDTIWVAAQGPLWTPGGERGVYRSTDGGVSWARTLGDDQWVGATDLALDPRDPDRLYAATWQRHRTVAAYLGGGEGSGLHRSDDGGITWQPLTTGLPETPMGKIGLALSPQQPDVVYAAIELERRTGGVFRSTDRGATWEKRSDVVSGGTGPHYYQELYASPHRFDRIYLADVRMQVSDDGGRTFTRLPEEHKHSDNHALAFKASDPDYLLIGTDGGLYESFDHGAHWRYFANLPLTQYYKIALDDTAPFYHVYGGTQDNATQRGPVRTDNLHGIRNADWRMVLDWDGHQPATEPGNPDIVYAERQQGILSRVDVRTGEVVDIQPQAEAGAGAERFNWDAPILISPHQPTRVYFASQRVWRSDDRGDSWTAVSGDLTRGLERIAQPIMGGTQSWDNAWDLSAMSAFGTITSLAESPLAEGLLYAGTDDGKLSVSENGGTDWRAIDVDTLPGVPAAAFVNDIKADLFDADTVYVALDHHKSGDFSPHLVRSRDRGRSWQSMRGDLPERTLVWRVVQDHVAPGLLFAATEFGLYVTVDGGTRWTPLRGGVPTIAFRDLAIHRRDDDLVAASFGRGIFVLDDLTPLRHVSDAQLARAATLFPVRDAWWYVPRPILGFASGVGDQGASHFAAPNPPFGAVFTVHLGEDMPPLDEARRERETAARAQGEPVAFPGWDAVERERRAVPPRTLLVVRDADGQVVRRLPGPAEKGFHRIAWDLRMPTPHALLRVEPPPPLWGDPPRGLLAAPGSYTVSLYRDHDSALEPLSAPQAFDVVPLRGGSLPGASPDAVASFWRRYEAAVRTHGALSQELAQMLVTIERMRTALQHSSAPPGPLDARWHAARGALQELDRQLYGHRARQQPGAVDTPTPGDRLASLARGIDRSTYGPTTTHRRSMEIVEQALGEIRAAFDGARAEVQELGRALQAAGAPWVEGTALPAAAERRAP